VTFPSGLNFCYYFFLCRLANEQKQEAALNCCFQLSLRKLRVGLRPCTSGAFQELACEISEQWLLSKNLCGTLSVQSNQAKVDCTGWVKHRAHSSLLNTPFTGHTQPVKIPLNTVKTAYLSILMFSH
jgi:hypothetical protein